MNTKTSTDPMDPRARPLHALMYAATLGIAVVGALSISLAAHAQEGHAHFEGRTGREGGVEHFERGEAARPSLNERIARDDERELGRDFDRGHDRERFVIGHRIDRLPERSIPLDFRGERYYVNNGVWFHAVGGAFFVATAPIGAFVPVLPFGYATLWVGDLPYYFANDVYYAAEPSSTGYRVIAPPVVTGGTPIQSAPLRDPE